MVNDICVNKKSFVIDYSNVTSRVAEIKMPIDFYQLLGSPPCRAVALTAAALDIEMNFKQVNLMNGEHLKPEFLKVRKNTNTGSICLIRDIKRKTRMKSIKS